MPEKLTPPQPTGIESLDRWLNLLWKKLTGAGEILWPQIDTSGSNLTDIETRNHNDLQNLNAGDYVHLTAANHTDLTDGGDSTLHFHATDRARANHTGTQDGTTVKLPALQTPTIDDVTDWFNTSSSGQVTGGIIADAGSQQITVSAGEGMIKSGPLITDPTFFCEWAAVAATTVTDARVTWVCVDYNAGNTAILILEGSSSTDFAEPAAINYNDCYPLGYVVRDGTFLHITNNPRKMQDVTGSLIRRFRQTLPLARDELVGGLLIAETGTRNITLSAGYLFDRQNRFGIAAIDTSVAGTFDRYYGATLDAAGATQWPNTQYNNAGVLTTMTNNRYANLYWYLDLDGNLIMIYGNNEYPSAAGAEDEALPTTLPLRANASARLIARTTFQKSSATFIAIDSAFTNIFATSAASTHNNLAGLQGGTAAEYYHLTSAEYTGTGTGNFVRETSPTLVTPILGTPTSGTVTNLTGTASININGTVGATTPAAGAFTTVTSTAGTLVIGAAGLGYGTGAGGTVTQLTSRTTAVQLDKPTGAIAMFSAAGSATPAQFTVTNSLVTATDVIALSYKGSSNVYQFVVSNVATGSFNISFWSEAGVATDAPTINFTIIKGATS